MFQFQEVGGKKSIPNVKVRVVVHQSQKQNFVTILRHRIDGYKAKGNELDTNANAILIQILIQRKLFAMVLKQQSPSPAMMNYVSKNIIGKILNIMSVIRYCNQNISSNA